MADKQDKKPTKPSSPATSESEREALIKAVSDLERDNRSLKGLLASNAPQVIEELRKVNDQLKLAVLASEKALALELLDRKTPIDAAAVSDTLQALKAAVLAYCKDREIEPHLWKKLESL